MVFTLYLISVKLACCVLSLIYIYLFSERSTDTEDYMQIQVQNHHSAPDPPKPPPPPPLPVSFSNNVGRNTGFPKASPSQVPLHQDTEIRKQHQPLSAISIQDLNSVQVNNKKTILNNI